MFMSDRRRRSQCLDDDQRNVVCAWGGALELYDCFYYGGGDLVRAAVGVVFEDLVEAFFTEELTLIVLGLAGAVGYEEQYISA